MPGLAVGIELDISGIADLAWLAAADCCPEEEEEEEHAAASSAAAAAPTAPRKTTPGCSRPCGEDLDMDGPPQAPALASRHRHRRFDDAC
jgi:hypothetical protein